MKIGFLVAGEKGIFERLKVLTDKAREETPLAIKLFQERLADHSVLEDMGALKIQSSELTFKLSQEIMNGAINPAVLRDLLDVAELMDAIFHDYYFIAREVNRMVSSGIQLPLLDKMTKLFVGMVNVADKQLEALGKLLMANSIGDVKSFRAEIDKLEQDGDDLKDAGFDDMYVNHTLFDYFSFQHYTEVLRKLDEISDGVEDMSDLMLEIVTTISR